MATDDDKIDDRMSTARFIEVTATDLPLHCPTPQVALWAMHPRVFLDFGAENEVMCPYCGTKYRLKEGEVTRSH